MKDYTSNNYCDFFWISDLLELKRDSNYNFFITSKKNKKVDIKHVAFFGTIIEIKQVGFKEFLYQVDDGTGVIACKHTEQQFENIIRSIENEQTDVLNQTLEHRQSLEQSSVLDFSNDDSIFNDRSMQVDEIAINKNNRLKGLHTIWDDIYRSFACLVEPYSVGDSVFIQGKLYTYFKVNQIYVNSIRSIDLSEEIILQKIKLDDCEEKQVENKTIKVEREERKSGLMTFDNIPNLNGKISIPRNIETPMGNKVMDFVPEVLTPKLDSNITFDTFTGES